MAHDFGIRNLDNGTDWVFFFGYCNGVMYKAFNKPQCDMIISGDNSVHRITEEEALTALKEAIDIFDNSNYPDPNRMNDIKSFYKKEFMEYRIRHLPPRSLANYKPATYEIWFS